MIYQFKVTLEDIHPPIWRSFQVDHSITFDQLHQTIQSVMGWTDSHLYEFNFGKKFILIPDPDFPPGNRTELHAKIETINQHIRLEGQKVEYIYDFGDYWVHRLILENILPSEEDKHYPYCQGGARNCPPEDCGGPYGYQQVVEILSNPDHPEYKDHVEWVGDDYDSEHFDLEEVNEILRERSKRLNPQKKKLPPAKPFKLTPAKLKKSLQGLSQPELIQLVLDSFKLSKEVEQLMTVKMGGEEATLSLLEIQRKKIQDQFFPDRGHGKIKLADAQKDIRDFEKITGSKKYTLELKLFYVEMGVEFTNAYGDIDERFYSSMEKMYATVIDTINKEKTNDLFNEYRDRLEAVVENTEGIGWGFHDQLREIHGELRWEYEE